MGRHSAPADGADEVDASAVAVAAPEASTGRHAGGDGAAPRPGPETDEMPAVPATPDTETQQIARIADPVLDQRIPEAATDVLPQLAGPPDAAAPRVQPAAVSAEDAAAGYTGLPDLLEPPPPAQDGPPPAPAEPAPPHATSADVGLLRRHADVRARCIAAVVVPFVVYTAALFAIGKASGSTYLIWIFAPLVTAGILVGVFLDLGHKRYGPSRS